MKQKVSVSMDKELLPKLKKIVEKGKFRNTSHIVEYAVKKLIENDEDHLV